jgi:hypothetical protein
MHTQLTAQTAIELHRRLSHAIQKREDRLTLDPGEYLVSRQLLPERFSHVTNNDHGLRRFLFDVEQAQDFVFDGQGARIVCVGEVCPLRIGNSRNVTVKNLAIDWWRPFFSQGITLDSGEGWIEFSMPESYPLRVDHGRLIAHDHHRWQTDFLWNLLPFDPIKKEVQGTTENWGLSRWHKATALGEGRFRLEADFGNLPAPGAPIVLMHGNRVAPGVWIENSEDVRLENVTLHHSGAMGFVAQLSRHITLDRCHVTPSADRYFSTWVDATHFTDCQGHLALIDCELRGQFDDASNIHQSYSLVRSKKDKHTLLCQAIHPQRYGTFATRAGDGAMLRLRRTQEMFQFNRARAVTALNEEFAEICFEEPVRDCDEEVILSLHNPENSSVVVRGCKLGANRGRGLLLNMESPILVENNHFHVSGRAIECMPDANYWWEGAPVQEMTIRNNVFENCNFGPTGEDLIYLCPEYPDGSDPREGALRSAMSGQTEEVITARPPVMKNITIEDNTFIQHTTHVLTADSIDGLVFRNNRRLASDDYVFKNTGEPITIGESVVNATIEPLFDLLDGQCGHDRSSII